MTDLNKSGRTFCYDLNMNFDWPCKEINLIYNAYIDQQTRGQLFAMPDGHLNILIYENDEMFINYSSQRICFRNDGYVQIVVTWVGYHDVNVYINAEKLNPYSDPEIKYFTLSPININNISSSLKVNDEIVGKECKEYIDKRKSLLNQELRPNSYRKTLDEELNDLFYELKGLNESVSRFFENNEREEHIRRYILNHLRLLICWQGEKKSYNPLLLRVAAYYDIPLPIYGFPKCRADRKFDNIAGLKDQPVLTINMPDAFIEVKREGMKIIDFQEWLNCLIYKSNGSKLTINDFIRDSSNKIASHNDRDLSESFIALEQTLFDSFDTAQNYCILKVASLVLILGKYVLEHPKVESGQN